MTMTAKLFAHIRLTSYRGHFQVYSPIPGKANKVALEIKKI